ncbi:MAG: hypothetical protein RID07_00665, partial [Lacipirellulaceae bacterium]
DPTRVSYERRLSFESFEPRLMLAGDSPLVFGSNFGDSIATGSNYYQTVQTDETLGDVIIGTIDETVDGNGATWIRLQQRNVNQFSVRTNQVMDGMHWLSAESGSYSVDGKVIEVGRIENASNGDSVTFSTSFSTPPVILAMVDESVDDSGATAARVVGNHEATGFTIWTDNTADAVMWIAMEPGLYLTEDFAWQAETFASPINNTTITFPEPFEQLPGVVATIHDINNSGPFLVRLAELAPTGFAPEFNFSQSELLHYIAFGSREEFLDDLTWDFSANAGDGLVRLNGETLEAVDPITQTVLFSHPLDRTNSLTLMGDSLELDFLTGSSFELPAGINIVGGAGTTDAFTLTSDDSAHVVHNLTVTGEQQITATQGANTTSIRYAGIEEIQLDSLFSFTVEGTLDLGSNSLTVESATPLNLGNLTLLDGGTLTANSVAALGAGESIVGSGTINARFSGEAGSLVRATGDLTIGTVNSTSGFYTRGDLDVGPHTVTLLDTDQAVLGTETQLGESSAAGTLVSDNGLIVDFGNNVSGFGTLSSQNTTAQAVINNGTITGNDASEQITTTGYVKGVGTFDFVLFNGTFAPGLSPAALDVGTVELSNSSKLEIELGGLSPGSGYDQLNSDATLQLEGGLVVEFLPGFQASPGDSFTILTAAGSVLGTFDTAITPAGLQWELLYEANEVRLSASALPGDYDNNGEINANDLGVWQSTYGSTTLLAADGDQNEHIDGGDFLLWQRASTSPATPAVQAAHSPLTKATSHDETFAATDHLTPAKSAILNRGTWLSSPLLHGLRRQESELLFDEYKGPMAMRYPKARVGQLPHVTTNDDTTIESKAHANGRELTEHTSMTNDALIEQAWSEFYSDLS